MNVKLSRTIARKLHYLASVTHLLLTTMAKTAVAMRNTKKNAVPTRHCVLVHPFSVLGSSISSGGLG